MRDELRRRRGTTSEVGGRMREARRGRREAGGFRQAIVSRRQSSGSSAAQVGVPRRHESSHLNLGHREHPTPLIVPPGLQPLAAAIP